MKTLIVTVMAERLRTRGPKPELILSSTALRALETSELLLVPLALTTRVCHHWVIFFAAHLTCKCQPAPWHVLNSM